MARGNWSGVSIVLLASALAASAAQAQLIGPGQEQAVLALFAPHEIGDEVAGGYALWNVAIEQDRIEITLHAEDGRETSLTLRHPDDASDDAARTTSFAIVPGDAPDEQALAARRALVLAITQNDHGGFWARAGETVTNTGSRGGGSMVPRSLGMWVASGWVPIDGLAVILLVYVLALLLAIRLLVEQPRWMSGALAGIVAAGVLVRLALSPPTFLGAWPWSRLYPHIGAVASGDWLAAVADLVGHPFFLTDVMMWTNFAYAVAMPLVLFSHATYLLRDARAGLAAAFAIAFLPQHIRFSLCEDGFVASLALTSLAFALIHGWLRDGSRVVRWFLVLALPVVLYPGYLLRPLNILFIVVYAGAILALHGETAPLWRRVTALVIVLGVGAAALYAMVTNNQEAVQSATSSLEWLGGIFRVLFSPSLLVISDPTRTPPLLIVLAVLGGVLAWRDGERRLVLFLSAWFLLFLAMHAFVIQESMQPRYHLHLVVPFLLLAASAVPRIPAQVPLRFRRWLWVGAAVIAASPLIHRSFVTDVEYAEMREYEIVHRARGTLPEGCTVLEFAAGPYEVDDLRFSRIGALAGTDRANRFRAIGVFAGGRTGPGQPSLEEIEADPPRCLYVYVGLACTRGREQGERTSHHCVDLRNRFRAELVVDAHVPARFYDRNAVGDAPLDARRVPLRLSRSSLGR